MDSKEKFIHRDLSWLSFNERVLEEAADAGNPLLERVKFLAIFAGNLDEFYMVRVAGLLKLVDEEYNQRDRYGYYPQEILAEIKARIAALNKKRYDLFQGEIKKELARQGIFIRTAEELSPEQKKHAKRFFETTLFPVITPMAVDQSRPFPVLPSKTLAFAVNVERKNELRLAIIPVPKNVPRFLKLPSENQEINFILIEEIIRENLERFFRGHKIADQALFRIIRDSELSVDEEYSADLLKAIEGEVKKRPRARVVYLESEKTCSRELLQSFCAGLDFVQEENVSIGSPLDMTGLYELCAQVDRPDLSYAGFKPGKIPYENIFARIAEGNFISHVPFQSFYPTVDLIRSAAKDDNVLAIKMTLYRTNEDSAIIAALKEAAKNKKQVTVLVEIKARFDEERNISWVKELEESGCHVLYGIAGLKIHSKMTLIVRKEEGRIRRYVHLSTGNYNEKTSRVYTDLGYFTANDDFARDISDVFNVITGYSVPSAWQRIVSSPNDLRKYFFDLIDREIDFQKRFKNGRIIVKMNSLEDTAIIEKLYAAAAAGVKIKLLVRGICCLLPGVKDLSENVEVRSIVGRFLEHTRIFLFGNNNDARVFLSSADWMTRNFDRRIELLFEIYTGEAKEHLQFLLNTYLKDNVKARILSPDGLYVRPPAGAEKFNSQEYLIRFYGGTP